MKKKQQLITDLWHFIENYAGDTSAATQEKFFALRERVRGSYGEMVPQFEGMAEIEIDKRFNVILDRENGDMEIRVYPYTDGQIWDAPCETFTVDEDTLKEQEKELRKDD